MWRRLTVSAVARARTPFSHVNHQAGGQQRQFQNQLHAAGGDGLSPAYSELVPSELIGLAQAQGLPPGAEGGELVAGCDAEGAGDGAVCETVPDGARATVLVNGVQSLSCDLPAEGVAVSEEVAAAAEVNVMGDLGGATLDLLFTVHAPRAAAWPEATRWAGRLLVRCAGSAAEHAITLGSVGGDDGGRTSHLAAHVGGSVASFRVEVTAVDAGAHAGAATPSELRLVGDVVDILDDARLNRHQGSLASVLVNNKAKDAPLYEAVVGGKFGGSWLDFVKAHPQDLHVFRYADREVKSRRLGTVAKAGDARIARGGRDRRVVAEADELHADHVRRQEVGIREFLTGALRDGDVCQQQLIERLRSCPEFCELLSPTLPLLHRFLARHPDLFVWNSSPDMPTRVGLSDEHRYPHRSRHSDFPAPSVSAAPKKSNPRITAAASRTSPAVAALPPAPHLPLAPWPATPPTSLPLGEVWGTPRGGQFAGQFAGQVGAPLPPAAPSTQPPLSPLPSALRVDAAPYAPAADARDIPDAAPPPPPPPPPNGAAEPAPRGACGPRAAEPDPAVAMYRHDPYSENVGWCAAALGCSELAHCTG